jgi:hypothetical protein
MNLVLSLERSRQLLAADRHARRKFFGADADLVTLKSDAAGVIQKAAGSDRQRRINLLIVLRPFDYQVRAT